MIREELVDGFLNGDLDLRTDEEFYTFWDSLTPEERDYIDDVCSHEGDYEEDDDDVILTTEQFNALLKDYLK